MVGRRRRRGARASERARGAKRSSSWRAGVPRAAEIGSLELEPLCGFEIEIGAAYLLWISCGFDVKKSLLAVFFFVLARECRLWLMVQMIHYWWELDGKNFWRQFSVELQIIR
jgi:hypothetical protein